MPAASTSRTTTKANANVVDFDASAKKRKKSPCKKLRAFGQDWQTQQANITVLVDFEEESSPTHMLAFIYAHIVKTQRIKFAEALKEQENMGAEEIFELMRYVEQAAYPDIPSMPS
mgnify:CR=1 FL=1